MSRPRVTITLGHGGGVVQKEASVINERNADRENLSGRKRSGREWLGDSTNIVQGYEYPHNTKRQREYGRGWDYNDKAGRDLKVGAHDLRLKLLRKKSFQSLQDPHGMQNGVRDLREKLSNKAQKQGSTRNSSRHVSYVSSPNQQISIVDGARTPNLSHQEYRGGNSQRSQRISPSRTGNAPQHGSPPTGKAPQHGSSPTGTNSARHAPTTQAVAATGQGSLLLRSSTSTRPVESTRSMPSSSAPGNNVNRSGCPSGTGIGETTVAGLLQSLGLSKYSIIFQAEEVDMSVLRHMRDDDLKELGIPMGPRKKILLALVPNSRRGSNHS